MTTTILILALVALSLAIYIIRKHSKTTVAVSTYTPKFLRHAKLGRLRSEFTKTQSVNGRKTPFSFDHISSAPTKYTINFLGLHGEQISKTVSAFSEEEAIAQVFRQSNEGLRLK